MATEFLIGVDDNGRLQYIYSDEIAFLEKLGTAETKRASHVEPNGEGKWEADMSPVNGPVLGPFNFRSQALAAEVAWLTENLIT